MIKLERYDPTKTYMFPNGAIADPVTVKHDFPAIDVFLHIIETDANSQMIYAVENLSALRTMYNVDPNISDDGAIVVIQDIRNTPPPEPEISSEERIAAALELSNLINM